MSRPMHGSSYTNMASMNDSGMGTSLKRPFDQTNENVRQLQSIPNAMSMHGQHPFSPNVQGNDDEFDDFGFDDIDEEALLREVELVENVYTTQRHHQPYQSHYMGVNAVDNRSPQDMDDISHITELDTNNIHVQPCIQPKDLPSPNEYSSTTHSHMPLDQDIKDGKSLALEQQLATLQSEISKLRRDLSTAESNMQNLTSDLQMKSGEISLIRKNLSQKMVENNELREKLSSTIETSTRSKDALKDMFKTEIEKLKTELAFKSQEIRLLQTQRKGPVGVVTPIVSQKLSNSPSQKAKGSSFSFPTVDSFHGTTSLPASSRSVDSRSIGINTDATVAQNKEEKLEKKTIVNYPIGEDIQFAMRRLFCHDTPTISACLLESGNAKSVSTFHDALCLVMANPHLDLPYILQPWVNAVQTALEHRHVLCLEMLTGVLSLSTTLSTTFCERFLNEFFHDIQNIGPISRLLDFICLPKTRDGLSILNDDLERIGMKTFDSFLTACLSAGALSHEKIVKRIGRERCISLLGSDAPFSLKAQIFELVNATYLDANVLQFLFVEDDALLLPWLRCLLPRENRDQKDESSLHIGFELLADICEMDQKVVEYVSKSAVIEELISILHKWMRQNQPFSPGYIRIYKEQLRLFVTIFTSGSATIRRSNYLKLLIADLSEIALLSADAELSESARDLLAYFIEDPEAALSELGLKIS